MRSREVAADAYAREAERLARARAGAARPAMPPPRASAVDLAYAVRWLELSADGSPIPAWLAWLDGDGPAPGRPAGAAAR